VRPWTFERWHIPVTDFTSRICKRKVFIKVKRALEARLAGNVSCDSRASNAYSNEMAVVGRPRTVVARPASER
jgi:hypothetical protein